MVFGKKIVRVTAALLVAFAAGHAAETLKARTGEKSISIEALKDSESDRRMRSATESAVPPAATLAAAGSPGMQDLIGITSVAATLPKPELDACSPALQLAAMPGALIHLSLSAPCNAGQRIVVRHSGLSFAVRTGSNGRVGLSLPALKQDAMVAVYLEDSRLLLGRIEVPDAGEYTRFALAWEAPTELEFRVTSGERILVGSPDVAQGAVPVVMSLGSPSVQSPLFAQVYSVPGPALDDAEITADLRITPATCGRTLRLVSLLSQNGVVSQADLPVAVPLCGTSGDILVLKNLAPKLTLATRN
jgi:hypothetical protein